ncbi:MAG: PQQ-binding-like beta-propeller repeat protein, partial [Chloroflexi bacterium]|nr:PQQ-binding-like beta-propeller repeat protein [Chloroflexota bacterium]
MLVAAACVGFNNPEGWAGPTAAADDLLVVSTDKGELSALDLAPESGPQCDNSTDDDEDGWVNEGCPRAGTKAERGRECANSTSDDAVDDIPDDDKINDGCPAAVPLWTFPTGQEEPEIDLEAIYTTPQVIGDTVYLGGYSGDVYALSLDDGSVLWSFDADGPIIAGLAASETAVYAATDKGDTSHNRIIGSEDPLGMYEGGGRFVDQVWKLHANGDAIYAGVSEAGLFVSRNRGESWDGVAGLNDHPGRSSWEAGFGGLCAHSILTDSNQPNRMWVGISAAGVYRTEDAGNTWQQCDQGINAGAG